jgi:hypothetical protein
MTRWSIRAKNLHINLQAEVHLFPFELKTRSWKGLSNSSDVPHRRSITRVTSAAAGAPMVFAEGKRRE